MIRLGPGLTFLGTQSVLFGTDLGLLGPLGVCGGLPAARWVLLSCRAMQVTIPGAAGVTMTPLGMVGSAVIGGPAATSAASQLLAATGSVAIPLAARNATAFGQMTPNRVEVMPWQIT